MRQRRSCAARGRVLVHSRPLTLRPRCASVHFPAPHRGPDRKPRAKDFWGICVSLEFYWASLQTSAHICISHIALHRIQSLHIRPDVHAWTEGSTLRISSTRRPQGRREQRCPFTLLWASRDLGMDHVGFHSSIACNQNTLRAEVPGSSV